MTRREFGLSAASLSGARLSADAARGTLVAFRIGHYQWLDDRRFEALLAWFDKYPGTADELAFFTAGTHPPRPLGETLSRAERLAGRMAETRKRGMRAGINVLATMGHLDENLDTSLNEKWQRIAGPDGREARGSYCPASAEFLDYAVKVYTAMAQASPDFIWVDDDVRMSHHPPVRFGCFCDQCLRRFSAEAGRPFTRQNLVEAFSSGELADRLRLRRLWLDHNRKTLDELLAAIERAVHKVQPGVSLGFMTTDLLLYDRYDMAGWAKTLGGRQNVEVRWRPGGGFYSEERPGALVDKAHDVARQVFSLPPTVTVIQTEIENFPYDLLRKSSATTALEAAVYMAGGSTGSAFNVLSQRPDPLDEYLPILRRISSAKPFYETLRRELGRSPAIGIWPAWNSDLFAANSVDTAWPDGSADAITQFKRTHVLAEIGIPLCYTPGDAVGAILSGPAVFAFSRDELKRIFSSGVLMDVAALRALERVGLAGWTGVKVGATHARDTVEQLTSHPVNGRFAMWSRDCRQSFWQEDAYSLEPRGAEVAALAHLIDYRDRDLGVSITAFENELGGRVVVLGYYPWSQLHNLAKSSQMKSICDWISRRRMPATLESFARIHMWVRRPAPGVSACFLLNGSLDTVEDAVVRLAGAYRNLEWTPFEGGRESLERVRVGDGRTSVTLPVLNPWSAALLVARE